MRGCSDSASEAPYPRGFSHLLNITPAQSHTETRCYLHPIRPVKVPRANVNNHEERLKIKSELTFTPWQLLRIIVKGRHNA